MIRKMQNPDINRIADMNRNVPYRKVIYASSGLKIDNIKYA